MKLKKINNTKYTIREILVWLWGHHRPCRSRAIINICIGLLQVAIGLIFVDVQRRLIDTATGNIPGSISFLIGIFVLIYVIDLTASLAYTWVSAVLGVKIQNNSQQMFFSRILNSKWDGISRFHSGDMINRLFGDVNDIVRLMTEALPSIITILVQFAASFVYLYSLNKPLALIVACVCPLFVLFSKLYLRKMRVVVRKIKDSNSNIQAIIQESIQHKMVIKVFNQADNMVDKLRSRHHLLHSQTKSRAKISMSSRVIIRVGFTGAYISAFTYGLYEIQDGRITVGIMLAFLQLINRVQTPMLQMGKMLPVFVNSLTSAERLIELEVLPVEDDARQHHLKGTVGVRLDNVSYKYTDNGREVLRNFSYDFKPGTFTAILGETGAGKTTVIRILLALIKANKGRATIYSDSEQCEVDVSTRCNFSYVPQGNSLFSGTIRENLRFGNPDATTEQMRQALHIAMADFVFELPDGLNTVCGEGGGGLSEGQAQRIAIARAIVRPSKVLLLDEATSALDIDTERELLMRIKQHYHDATVIFVTHRLAVVEFTTDNLRMERNI